MALFVKLNDRGGGITFVNVDAITRMNWHGDYTSIQFDQGNATLVKESPEQILAAAGPDRFPKAAHP